MIDFNTTLDRQTKLLQYVNTELLSGRHTLTPEDDLLGSGMVDSMGMMWLIGFIEDDLGVKVPPEDLTIQHFRTIATIDAYLAQKTA